VSSSDFQLVIERDDEGLLFFDLYDQIKVIASQVEGGLLWHIRAVELAIYIDHMRVVDLVDVVHTICSFCGAGDHGFKVVCHTDESGLFLFCPDPKILPFPSCQVHELLPLFLFVRFHGVQWGTFNPESEEAAFWHLLDDLFLQVCPVMS